MHSCETPDFGGFHKHKNWAFPLRFIRKQGSSAFFSGKISRSFIYPFLNNSEQNFKKYLFQNYRVPSYFKSSCFCETLITCHKKNAVCRNYYKVIPRRCLLR